MRRNRFSEEQTIGILRRPRPGQRHVDLCSSVEEVMAMAEVVVIANGTAAFCRVPGLLRADQILIDLVGLTTGYNCSA